MATRELSPDDKARGDRERLLIAVLNAVSPQHGHTEIGFEVDAGGAAALITITYRYYTTSGDYEIAQTITLSHHVEPVTPDAPAGAEPAAGT